MDQPLLNQEQGVYPSYTHDPCIIDKLSVTFAGGECVAITGVSGVGKSTFVMILAGLLKAGRGDIYVDGARLSDRNLACYRRNIGVVLQRDTLFSGTILDNITGFDPEGDYARAMNAATLADVCSFIDTVKCGYYAMVGDMGSTLSAGQTQRILLARAIYREPRIFILDEGLANVDPGSEERIISNLRALKRTVISVAHRSRIIELADRVFELRDGRLLLRS